MASNPHGQLGPYHLAMAWQLLFKMSSGISERELEGEGKIKANIACALREGFVSGSRNREAVAKHTQNRGWSLKPPVWPVSRRGLQSHLRTREAWRKFLDATRAPYFPCKQGAMIGPGPGVGREDSMRQSDLDHRSSLGQWRVLRRGLISCRDARPSGSAVPLGSCVPLH